jgi:glycerol-3-phosphate dehydrogenase (NAD+)
MKALMLQQVLLIAILVITYSYRLGPMSRVESSLDMWTSATAGYSWVGANLDSDKDYSQLKFAIFGGGAFSLALAKVLSYKNIQTKMLVRGDDVAEYINSKHYHPKYLTDSLLPTQLYATVDPVEALSDADYIIHAVPMQQSRKFLEGIKHHIKHEIPILSVTKGVEQGTFSLMNDIISETLGETKRAAFLSGPSFAKEIMNGEATAVVVASSDDVLATELAEILSSIEFRCHTSRDVKGVELGGAIKNVIALSAGMCEGLGLGMNAMSSLVTRGCTEMGRMGKLFGAEPETFFGLAGVGDTFGTCLGPLSRNRNVGIRLAKGEKLEDILNSSDGVAEGVFTALALEQLIKTKVKPSIFQFKFPIISGVAAILKGSITPKYGLQMLMQYPIRDENRG